MRYTVRGVEKALSLGVYPEITLKQARQRREEIRSKIANGVDPSEERKAERRALDITFEAVAREWWGKRKALWTEGYAAAIMMRFEKDVFPFIGRSPVKHLDAADFLECLQRIEKRGVLDTAHKIKTKCSEVMRYAVVTRRAVRDPTVDLKGALMPARRKHYATITYPSEIGALCGRSMDTEGSPRSFIAPCGCCRWFSFDPQSCGMRGGKSSIWKRGNGRFPRSA